MTPARGTAPTTVSNGVARTQFAARADGASAGLAREGGKTVFARPAAKASGSGGSRAPARVAASPRSASGDLWSGFKAGGGGASVLAAESAAAKQDAGGLATAALALLGLGLAGLVGSASVFALSRRTARARTGGGRSQT